MSNTPLHKLIASTFLTFLSFAGPNAAEMEPGEETIGMALSLGIPAPQVAPAKGKENRGPFNRLVIANVMMIDGTGAPPQGPVNIVVEHNRIVSIAPAEGIGSSQDLPDGEVIDASGKFAIPGLIDTHAHLGSPYHALSGSFTHPEYVNKLWLAHGVTTVRDVGALLGLEWTLAHKKRSEDNTISAPRYFVYALFPTQHASAEAARKWVRAVQRKGADGIKFLGAAPELVAAAIDEARKLNIGTAQHHAQLSVTRLNVLDTARLGLDSMEHWYGLPEAMFDDRLIQDYPYDYNYSNEQDRFREAGKLWQQAATRGSPKWNETIDELIGLDFTMVPTFTIYEANRDLMREQRAVWHDEYAMPYILKSFRADPHTHGSYFFNWTTADEISWKTNFRRWMDFINDYKNRGGRVTTGSDSGFIWKIYGFGFVRELELLQEAGFHPLEVLQSATLNGAELLGVDNELGTLQVGKKADMVIVNENPLENFKVLYGTGHRMLNTETGQMQTSTGIEYTIKDGVVFDAKQLLTDVRNMVAEQKAKSSSNEKQSLNH